jgi:serine/threonine-protein kinase
MSPEQARGHDSDHRSDIFSVGAVIYRTLTGHTPFTASNLPQTLFRIVYINPKDPATLLKDLPEDIAKVLALAVAKRPDDRFNHIQDLVDAFEDARFNNLSPELRHKADELLKRSPWNANLSEHSG